MKHHPILTEQSSSLSNWRVKRFKNIQNYIYYIISTIGKKILDLREEMKLSSTGLARGVVVTGGPAIEFGSNAYTIKKTILLSIMAFISLAQNKFSMK